MKKHFQQVLQNVLNYYKMDKEKLNKAAKHEAYNNCSISYKDYKEGFIKSADWLMTQPLINRLTDEEKEKIMQIYRHASHPCNRVTFAGQTVLRLFPSIFGKELFNEE